MKERMIRLTFSQHDIDALNDQRFHHPDPLVMKRCETVYLKSKGFKTGHIRCGSLSKSNRSTIVTMKPLRSSKQEWIMVTGDRVQNAR